MDSSGDSMSYKVIIVVFALVLSTFSVSALDSHPFFDKRFGFDDTIFNKIHSGNNHPPSNNSCQPDFQLKCYKGNSYNYDSCGNRGNLNERCSGKTECVQGVCVFNPRGFERYQISSSNETTIQYYEAGYGSQLAVYGNATSDRFYEGSDHRWWWNFPDKKFFVSFALNNLQDLQYGETRYDTNSLYLVEGGASETNGPYPTFYGSFNGLIYKKPNSFYPYGICDSPESSVIYFRGNGFAIDYEGDTYHLNDISLAYFYENSDITTPCEATYMM